MEKFYRRGQICYASSNFFALNFPCIRMKRGWTRNKPRSSWKLNQDQIGCTRRCGAMKSVSTSIITCQPWSSKLRSTALSHMTASPAWKSRSLQHRSRRKMPKHFNNSEVEAQTGVGGKKNGKSLINFSRANRSENNANNIGNCFLHGFNDSPSS